MYTFDLLKQLNEEFALKRLTFSKEIKDFNAGRDVRFGRMHGIFTPAYWKRDTLFAQGEIIYGLTFKSYINEFSSDKSFPTWVLFSPNRSIQDNPNFYHDIITKLRDLLEKKPKTRQEKYIKAVLESNLEEPYYLEIPEPYNLGYLCYLSVCYVRPNHFRDFHMGINLFLMGKKISKEIVYVPEKYWTDAYKDLYYHLSKVEK